MADEIDVRIRMQTDDLAAGAQQARAEIASLAPAAATANAQLGSLNATASVSRGGFVALGSALSDLKGGLNGLSDGLRTLDKDTSTLHGSIPVATREFRALFDELSSGRTRMTPGTLAILGQRVFNLGPAGLAAAAGVLAVVAALGYLIVKSIETENAMNRLKIAADFGGNFDVTRQQLKQFADEAGTDGQQIVDAYARLGGQSAAQIEALTVATAEYAEAAGEKGPEAVKQLTAVMDGQRVSLAELDKLFPATTQAERENFLAVQQLGDAHKTTAALVKLVDDQISGARADQIEYASGWTSIGNDVRYAAAYITQLNVLLAPLSAEIELGIGLWNRWGSAIQGTGDALGRIISAVPGATAVLNAFNPVAKVQSDLTEENTKRIDARTAAGNRAAAAAGAEQNSAEATIKSGMQAAETFATETKRADELTGAIKRMQAAQNAPGATGTERATLSSAIADAQRQETEAAKRAKTEEFDNFKAMEDAKADASKSGSAARIAAARDEVEKAKDLFGQESTEYYQAVGRLNSAKREGAAASVSALREGGEQEIAIAREQISEIQANDQTSAKTKAALEQQVWQQVLSTARLNAQERLEVERSMNEGIAQAHRAAAAETRQIDQSNAETGLQIAKIGFQEQRDLLQQQVAEHQISKVQELQQLLVVAAAEGKAEQDTLAKAQAGYAADSAAFIEKENQKRIAAAQTQAEIDKINLEIVQAETQAARQSAQAWNMGIDEITSAERTFLGGWLSGRQSALQAAEAASAQFIQKEIEDDVAYYTKKLLLSQQEFAAEKVQGGLLATALNPTTPITGAAGAAAAAPQTAATTANTAALTANTAALSGQGAVVSANTAATGAGTAATTTNAAATATNTAATGINVAATGTNVAATTANTSVQATGIIAWVGNTVATIANTISTDIDAAAKFFGFASGADNIPHDMVANIHKGEMIIPAVQAEALRGANIGSGPSIVHAGDFGPRNSGEGLSSTNGAANNVTNSTHYNKFDYSPSISGNEAKSLSQSLVDEAGAMRQWFAQQIRDGAIRI